MGYLRLLLLINCSILSIRSLYITLQEGILRQRNWQSAYNAAERQWLQDTDFIVSDNENGTKLASYCAAKLGGSVKKSKELAKEGMISVNGYKSYGSRKLKSGDEVRICGTSYREQMMSNLDVTDTERLQKLLNFVNNLLEPSRNPPLKVLFEDQDIAVVLKPAGVHSLKWLGTMKKDFYCLDHSLRFILTPPLHKDSLIRPLPCHRLDSRVSGCLICAKSTTAQSSLAKQFQDHTIEKEYTAILIGNVQSDSFVITDKIDGLDSESEVVVLSRTPCQVYGCLTTVNLLPRTGRRHQLRRHCAGMGHPILGDDLYHDSAGYVQKEHRLKAIAQVALNVEDKAKVAGSSSLNMRYSGNDNESEVSRRNKYDESISEQSSVKTMEYERVENFRPVRRGVGLFLMSTAVKFYHPVRQKCVEVKCELAPRFKQVLLKAERGSTWSPSS